MSNENDWLKNWPTECWCVTGITSRGGPFFSRVLISKDIKGDGFAPTSQEAKVIQDERAAYMNGLGANVRVIRQTRSLEDLLFHDCEEATR